jgi:predicted RNase H-like HicB family nuclease
MKKVKFQVKLPVSILREGKSFIAYTPVLDLSTVGKSFEEAQERFTEIVQIFLEELVEAGTLDEVLNGLGWQKINNTFTPPVLIAHQTQNFSIPTFVN